MNRVYKLIRNKSGEMAVTSELGKSKTKNNKKIIGLAIASIFGLFGNNAMALEIVGSQMKNEKDGITISECSPLDNTSAINNSIQIGCNANTNETSGAIAIGLSSNAINSDDITIGRDAKTLKNSTSYVNSIAIGSNAESSNGSIVMGNNSTATGKDNVIIGNNVRGSEWVIDKKPDNMVSIGNQSSSNNSGDIAIGYNARTQFWYSVEKPIDIVSGDFNIVKYKSPNIAIGANSSSSGQNNLTIGLDSLSNGHANVSLGNNIKAYGIGTTAIGTDTFINTGKYKFDSNTGTHTDISSSGLALGGGSTVLGLNSGVISNSSKKHYETLKLSERSVVGADDSYAIGNSNLIGDKSNDTFILGNNVKLGADNIKAYGGDPTDNHDIPPEISFDYIYGNAKNITGMVALGSNTQVEVSRGVALGYGSKALRDRGEVGYLNEYAKYNITPIQEQSTWTSTTGAIAVGTDDGLVTRQITGVAAGSKESDAVNVAQLMALENKLNNNGGGSSNQDINISNTDGKVDITEEVSGIATDPKKITVNLSDETKTSLAKADTALQDIKTQIDGIDVKTINKDNNTANFTTGKNMSLTANPDGSINIATKDDVAFTSVNAGNVLLSNNTIALGGKTYISDTGVNANNQKVINVADGEISSTSLDAVNGKQMWEMMDKMPEVENGINTGVTKKTVNGKNTYSIDTDKTVVKGNNETINISSERDMDNRIDTYSIDLSDKTKESLVKADTALQDIKTQIDGVDVKTINKDNNTANFTTGKNMSLTANPDGSINIATKDDVNFKSINTESLNAGNILLSNNTIALGGKTYISDTGVNANNQKVINVADGVIAQDSLDAINGKQIWELQKNVGSTITTVKTEVQQGENTTVSEKTGENGQSIYTVSADKSVVANQDGGLTVDEVKTTNTNTYNVNLSEKTKESLGKADTALQDIVTQIDGIDVKTVNKDNNKVNFINGKNIELTNQNGSISVATKENVNFSSVVANMFNAGNVSLSNNAIALGGKTYISNTGLNANNQKVINVADGVIAQDSLDAVNGKQIWELKNDVAKAKTEVKQGNNIIVTESIGNNGQSIYTVSAKDIPEGEKTIVANQDGGLAIGVVKDGNTNTYNVNLSEKTQESLDKADTALQNVVTQIDGVDVKTVTKDNNNINFTTGDNIKISANPDGSIDIATSKDINVDSVNVKGGVSLSETGIDAANKLLVNVANGKIESGSKDAVNGGQVFDLLKDISGGTFDQLELTDDEGNTYKSDGNKANISGDKNIATKITDTGIQVSLKDNIDVKTIKSDSITTNDIDIGTVKINKDTGIYAGDKVISGVANGEISATSTDAVNGSQVYKIAEDVDKNKTDIAENKKTIEKHTESIEKNTTDIAKGLNFADNKGNKVNKQLGDTVGIINTDKNINTTLKDGNISVDLAKEIAVEKINVSGITINKEGMDVNDTRIKNVADGVNDTDAVNMRQLSKNTQYINSVKENLNQKIEQVDDKASAGVAAAMAVAGLPQAYSPGANMVSIAGSTYRGKTGYAIGISSITENGKWVVKATGSGNSSGHYGATAGVGYQW